LTKTIAITAIVLVAVVMGMSVMAPAVLQQAEAHNKPGHDKGPKRGGNGETDSATIKLIVCDDDSSIAKWRTETDETDVDGDGLQDKITYLIDNKAGLRSNVIQAVRDGIEEWDDVKDQNFPDSPYQLDEITSGTADVTIKVFNKITPGFILGFADVNCPGTAGIQNVSISLGVKGLKINGVENLSSHEFGHALGLVHTTNKNSDLMGPSLDAKERRNSICPSNLDIEALTEEATTYSVDDWTQLMC